MREIIFRCNGFISKIDTNLILCGQRNYPARHQGSRADALTHAIEAYISVNANPYSDGHALQAIRLIGRALKKAVENGNDKQARIDMAYGSYIARTFFF